LMMAMTIFMDLSPRDRPLGLAKPGTWF